MQKAEKMPTASSLPVCKKLSHYDGRRVVRHGEVCWGNISSSKFGCHLKSDAGCTNRVQAPLFSPIFSGKAEKMGPPDAFQRTTQRHSRWVERKKRTQRIRGVVYGGSFWRGRF